MSSDMKAVFEALLPAGAIWRPKVDGDFDKLLAAIGENAQEFYEDLASLADIRNPRRTPILEDLEKEYGIVPNLWLGEQYRLDLLLMTKYAVPNTASDDHLQDRLREAGFDGIVVTSNDPAVDPDLISGELLVTTPLYETQRPAYLAQANGQNTFAGNARAVAGYYLNIHRDRYEYEIPDDWRYWRYVFFVGGAASGWPGSPAIATYDVDWKRESEIKRLILAGKPLHTWAVLVVDYIMFWTHRDQPGGDIAFYGSAYGAGTHLLVGTGAKIQTSPDGENWTAQTKAGSFTGTFKTATYGNGLFVIAGGNGEIQTSPDGENWTQRTAAGSYTGDFNASAFNGSLFVLVGDNGEIQTSPDGENWTQRTAAGSYTGDFEGANWGGNQFVIVGSNGEIQTSPNGIDWTAQTPDASYSGTFYAAAYGNDIHVIVGASGEIQASYDGVTWEQQTDAVGFTGYFNAALFGNGAFVIVGGSGEIQRSADGKTWKHETPDASFSGSFNTALVGNYIFVIAGSQGEIQTS